MSTDQLDVYTEHLGSIKISGATRPREAANCAWHFLRNTKVPAVDFVVIGANANHQAAKAMGILAYQYRHSNPHALLAFMPLRFLTSTKALTDGDPARFKDCMVWRSVIVDVK